MNILNIYDPQNTWVESLRRRMWDGNEFKRQAETCAEWYADGGCSERPELLPIRGKNAFEKRQKLFWELTQYSVHGDKFDRINLFCHGGEYNLNRKMISMVNIEKFAVRLKSIATEYCVIVLYSCWTGKQEDGFAAELSRLTNMDVICHTTRGHTTRNPYKNIFAGDCRFYHHDKKLWVKNGGIRVLGKILRKTPTAPFEFVEHVISG